MLSMISRKSIFSGHFHCIVGWKIIKWCLLLCLAAMATRTYRHIKKQSLWCRHTFDFYHSLKAEIFTDAVCYHTFEVISPRISKKIPFLPPETQNASKASYNPFCRDFARTLDIGRRKSSLSKNGLFNVCCYKNAYKSNITYILTYFTLRTAKTMKLQKIFRQKV